MKASLQPRARGEITSEVAEAKPGRRLLNTATLHDATFRTTVAAGAAAGLLGGLLAAPAYANSSPLHTWLNRTISAGCGHCTDTDGTFWHLASGQGRDSGLSTCIDGKMDPAGTVYYSPATAKCGPHPFTRYHIDSKGFGTWGQDRVWLKSTPCCFGGVHQIASLGWVT
jgi:hypothetical protein